MVNSFGYKTDRAVEESFKIWVSRLHGKNVSNSCPLCKLHRNRAKETCFGCPIYIKTKQHCCRGTTYFIFNDDEKRNLGMVQLLATLLPDRSKSFVAGATVKFTGWDWGNSVVGNWPSTTELKDWPPIETRRSKISTENVGVPKKGGRFQPFELTYRFDTEDEAIGLHMICNSSQIIGTEGVKGKIKLCDIREAIDGKINRDVKIYPWAEFITSLLQRCRDATKRFSGWDLSVEFRKGKAEGKAEGIKQADNAKQDELATAYESGIVFATKEKNEVIADLQRRNNHEFDRGWDKGKSVGQLSLQIEINNLKHEVEEANDKGQKETYYRLKTFVDTIGKQLFE